MHLLSVPGAEERVGTTTAILQHCSHVVLAEQQYDLYISLCIGEPLRRFYHRAKRPR